MFWGIEEYPILWSPDNKTSSSLTTRPTVSAISPAITPASEADKDVETPFLMMARDAQKATTSTVTSLHTITRLIVFLNKDR